MVVPVCGGGDRPPRVGGESPRRLSHGQSANVEPPRRVPLQCKLKNQLHNRINPEHIARQRQNLI